MQKKTIIIDVETDEGVKSLNRLEASFEDVYGEVQPLTGRLGELEDQLYEMANAGDTSSDAFKALSAEVGRMKKTVMEVDMQVDALSTTTGQKLGGAISGLAGGFELAQGAMGAFGVESAKVEEALLRVNSAMAIAQGVQSVRESIPAFKALNAVIMANPIAAVVTAFIALSAAAMAWASQVSTKVSDGFKKTADAAEGYRKNLAKANEEQNKTTDKVLKSLDQEAERRKAMGEDAVKVQREINAQKIKELEIAIERDRSEIRSLNNQKENLKLAQEKAKLEIASQVREESKNLANAAFDWQRTKALNRIANLGEELNKIDKEGSEQISAINQQLKDRIGELETQKDAVESLKNEQIALNREQGEKAAEARQKAAEAAKDEAEKMKEFAKSLDDALGMQNEDGTSGLLPPPDVVAEEFDAIIDVTEEAFSTMDHIQMNWSNNFKDTFNRTVGFASDALGSIQELADAFAGNSEASQRKAFKIRKAAAIAQTTIETYRAAQGAYASQIIPGDPTSPIRGAIAATIAVASGLAKVKAIASQQFEGGGSASATGGGGAVPTPASSPAQFNIVGNSGTNQLMEGLSNSPVQAYVVAGEVTTAQSLDRNRISTATL